MVMESVHGVMRRVAGLARAHARARCARRGDFRTPRGGASSRCGNALRMRRPAGERQCGSLIEPVEDAVTSDEELEIDARRPAHEPRLHAAVCT